MTEIQEGNIKKIKKNRDLKIIIVGDSGTGKTSFVNK